MSCDESLCVHCAARQQTCCQAHDIYVSLTDLRRIREFVGGGGFWEYRVPVNAAYLDSDDDPLWQSRVIRPGNSRRVLKQQVGGDCHFLRSTGCRLPMEVRPLVCRLHPCEYDEQGIWPELSPGCPWFLLAPGRSLHESVGMSPPDARRWHRQLYQEIRQEPCPMRIGLTYDLRSEYLAMGYSELETAEFDRPDTVDAIERALRGSGHETDRIGHVRQLVQRLAAGDRWDLVFNICEGLHGRARESQVPALLDAYNIPYTFSDPLVLAVSLDKGITKTLLEAAGVPTPKFAVVRAPDDIGGVHLGYPVFAKPIAEGTGKGITPASRISTPEQLRSVCVELLEAYRQPVLVETYLPGREFTVGIWGTGDEAEVIGTMEIVLGPNAEAEVYSYVNKEYCEDRVEYRHGTAESDVTVSEAEIVALAAWRALGGRDAGRVDVRCDAEGRVQVIELNPLAGIHPEHSDLPMICTARQIPYAELIERIVQSAARRVQSAERCLPGPAGQTCGKQACV
ncbi:MAG: hypothetical protein ACYC6Y_04675 [Thermoguttaceae bacterium]